MEPARQTLAEYLATRDVACPKCGYNLRALKVGTCPECGWEIDFEQLREPGVVRLGLWFWIGVIADFNVTCWLAYPVARGQDRFMVMAAAVAASCAFTCIFVCLAMIRRWKHGMEVFTRELTCAIWVPLLIKMTCVGGMMFGGV